mmetsp:Transcript_29351/g.52550  ORF Transcript_29351/g.52550 Transcript_29351/m.52550 type:complete len:156 (-) Transcript_29351:1145-1612(-)
MDPSHRIQILRKSFLPEKRCHFTKIAPENLTFNPTKSHTRTLLPHELVNPFHTFNSKLMSARRSRRTDENSLLSPANEAFSSTSSIHPNKNNRLQGTRKLPSTAGFKEFPGKGRLSKTTRVLKAGVSFKTLDQFTRYPIQRFVYGGDLRIKSLTS